MAPFVTKPSAVELMEVPNIECVQGPPVLLAPLKLHKVGGRDEVHLLRCRHVDPAESESGHQITLGRILVQVQMKGAHAGPDPPADWLNRSNSRLSVSNSWSISERLA